MNLLNLDTLTKAKRFVKIQGVNYPVADRTVGQMLEAAKNANEIDEGASPEVITQAMLSTALEILPTCPEKTLRSLPMESLLHLIEWASNGGVDGAEDVQGEEVGEDGKKSQP